MRHKHHSWRSTSDLLILSPIVCRMSKSDAVEERSTAPRPNASGYASGYAQSVSQTGQIRTPNSQTGQIRSFGAQNRPPEQPICPVCTVEIPICPVDAGTRAQTGRTGIVLPANRAKQDRAEWDQAGQDWAKRDINAYGPSTTPEAEAIGASRGADTPSLGANHVTRSGRAR